MVALPIRDSSGNALVDFHFVAEDESAHVAEGVAMPASLVVVNLADDVLMIFDGWRRQWELPGGMREPGETARQAAVRELHEETGIHATEPTFTAVAEFDLKKPDRRELLAVYHVRLQAVPQLTVNDEALDFRWWAPSSPVSDDMSPLDAEIARLVDGRRATPIRPEAPITDNQKPHGQ
ncbi:NUDIX hydrolase [Amycolatopsis sp. QT-25]|nr:NUDIX hydrolase [Amycolatopsis sp. QT-25]WET83109.1 NUDIX hydrolase [Amycolatopsis sp. QT-25]